MATEATRRLIMTEGTAELQHFRDTADGQLASLQEQHESIPNDEARAGLALVIAYYQGIVESLPTLTVRLPNLTASRHMTFHGSRRTAQLLGMGAGHTGNDSILYLPDNGVVFMSDLLFIGLHPYLADGNPERAREVLKEVAGLSPQVLVPGHGPPGTVEDLRRMDDYIVRCQRLAQQALADPQGALPDHHALGEPFARWSLPHFFQANLQFLLKRY